jgi:hypothetical protein
VVQPINTIEALTTVTTVNFSHGVQEMTAPEFEGGIWFGSHDYVQLILTLLWADLNSVSGFQIQYSV